jgi:hypothetical protein
VYYKLSWRYLTVSVERPYDYANSVTQLPAQTAEQA